MAVELQVYVALVDTEPENPMSQGIMMRSTKNTTLTVPENISAKNMWALGRSRLDTLVTEVVTDMREQMTEIEQSLEE